MGSDIPQGNTTYDAARANMGSTWKIPNNIQVQALINGTNRIWTTMNGVNGAKFTNKTDPTKYIFIPAAGFFAGTELTASRSYCYYWYISGAGAGSQGCIIQLADGNFTTSSTMCYYGCPVRAIQ